jgi:hypothetical protein
MNNELERIWKEVIVGYFMVISRYLNVGSEENSGSCSMHRDINAYTILVRKPEGKR